MGFSPAGGAGARAPAYTESDVYEPRSQRTALEEEEELTANESDHTPEEGTGQETRREKAPYPCEKAGIRYPGIMGKSVKTFASERAKPHTETPYEKEKPTEH